MSDIILKDRPEAGIVVLTLNRPASMNSLNTKLVSAIKNEMDEAAFDNSIRVIIITGAGPQEGKKASFSSGADLMERRTMSDDDVKRFIAAIRESMTSIENVPMPVIAAINGFALGGGLEIALAADLRIASANAVMGLTETSLAVIPGGGGTQRLPRIVGLGKAKELIYTARQIDAQEALEIGLVNRVVEPSDLMEASLFLAREIAANGPVAIQQTKFAINYGSEVSLSMALSLESRAYEKTLATKDRREALAAFAEKRKPEFKGE
jgi:enoyl-CoA hydratase/carnithine racemase